MRLFALFALVHMVYHLLKRGWNEGFFITRTSGDLLHTALIVFAGAMLGWTIGMPSPELHWAPWVGFGIYLFSLFVPGLLVELALRGSDWKRGETFLKIAVALAPTSYHRQLLEMYVSTNSALETQNESIANLLRTQVEEAEDEEWSLAVANYLTFLAANVSSARAFEALRLLSADGRWHADDPLRYVSPPTKAQLMEGAALEHDSEWFEALFASIVEDAVEGRTAAGRAYLMAGTMILALTGMAGGLRALLKGLDKYFPDGFTDRWLRVAEVKKEMLANGGDASHKAPSTSVDPEVEALVAFEPPPEMLSHALMVVLSQVPIHEVAYALRQKVSFPLVTGLMVGALIVYYALELYMGGPDDPAALMRLGANVRFLPFQPFRLLTAWLLHGGVAHLLLNAYALWVLGRMVEHHYGRAGTWTVAALSAIGGNALSYFYHQGFGYSVGASTVVFGLMGAGISMLVLDRKYFPKEWRSHMLTTLMFWLVVNVLFGLSMKIIDNAGHIGGLISGLAAGALASRTLLGRFRTAIVTSLALVLLILQGWALVEVIHAPSAEPWHTISVPPVTMDVPYSWLRLKEKGSVHVTDPTCGLSPTVRVIPIETDGGVGDLNLQGLAAERLDILRHSIGYAPSTKEPVRVPPWFGLMSTGAYKGETIHVDVYLRRYGDRALLFVEFVYTPACARRVRDAEERVLKSVRWKKWDPQGTVVLSWPVP